MYMSCIKHLEDQRQKWILEMEDSCNVSLRYCEKVSYFERRRF